MQERYLFVTTVELSSVMISNFDETFLKCPFARIYRCSFRQYRKLLNCNVYAPCVGRYRNLLPFHYGVIFVIGNCKLFFFLPVINSHLCLPRECYFKRKGRRLAEKSFGLFLQKSILPLKWKICSNLTGIVFKLFRKVNRS